MKLMIVLTFCLGFVACIPGPRDQVIINVKSRPAPIPNSDLSDLAAPEEPSASNKITPEMAEKLNELFHTGSNYLERFVNFLGSIFTEGSSAEEEEPVKPKKKFFRQFWTSPSGNRPGLVGYNPQPGSILVRAGNPVTAAPYDPYIPPDPRLQRRSWGSSNWGWGK